MRRGTTREKTEALIGQIRSSVKDIAIRTTFIVGHPGETENDFQEMLEFIKRSKFDRAGCFTYSHEENTHAYSMTDDVTAEEKQSRVETLMSLQESISLELNQKKIGKTFKILVDRKEGDQYIGRTEHDSPEVDNEVLISSPDTYLRIGDFTSVTIDDASEFDLMGTVTRRGL